MGLQCGSLLRNGATEKCRSSELYGHTPDCVWACGQPPLFFVVSSGAWQDVSFPLLFNLVIEESYRMPSGLLEGGSELLLGNRGFDLDYPDGISC